MSNSGIFSESDKKSVSSAAKVKSFSMIEYGSCINPAYPVESVTLHVKSWREPLKSKPLTCSAEERITSVLSFVKLSLKSEMIDLMTVLAPEWGGVWIAVSLFRSEVFTASICSRFNLTPEEALYSMPLANSSSSGSPF